MKSMDSGYTDPGGSQSRPRSSRPEVRLARVVVELIVMVGLALVLSMFVRAAVAQALWIPTGSMEPTVMTDDRVIAEKVSLYFHDPKSGDVIAFDNPAGVAPLLFKRVIAVGGQTVDIRDGHLIVDGEVLDEPYVHGARTQPGTVALPLVVPEDYLWVMGDNRENSHDSRYFGPQPVTAVKGRAVFIYWPPTHVAGL
ncbi:MAG: signal peptidase I [Thermoleophilia bacterium]